MYAGLDRAAIQSAISDKISISENQSVFVARQIHWNKDAF
jgi:hypothetical protein